MGFGNELASDHLEAMSSNKASRRRVYNSPGLSSSRNWMYKVCGLRR